MSQLIAPSLEHWGKLQWREGGDMMHASEIGKHGGRDMTRVKFNGRYGQLRLLLLVKLAPAELRATTITKIHILAAVAPSVTTKKNRLDMLHTKGNYSAIQIIDAHDLDFVVGRVPDRGEFIFIERFRCNAVLDTQEDPEEAVVPRNRRQRRVGGV
ncbi:hypothetical protein C8J57DRAFT_1566608 [Mycena rebaudengoi]|nr:hypothetical protein C8J57DRAFT_1566608 [Mycena rebaudengoi]